MRSIRKLPVRYRSSRLTCRASFLSRRRHCRAVMKTRSTPSPRSCSARSSLSVRMTRSSKDCRCLLTAGAVSSARSTSQTANRSQTRLMRPSRVSPLTSTPYASRRSSRPATSAAMSTWEATPSTESSSRQPSRTRQTSAASSPA